MEHFDKYQIEQAVRGIIIDKLGLDESELTPYANFTNDLGADSLDFVELIMDVETKFGIEIRDDQAEKMSCLQDILDYIENNEEKIKQSVGGICQESTSTIQIGDNYVEEKTYKSSAITPSANITELKIK